MAIFALKNAQTSLPLVKTDQKMVKNQPNPNLQNEEKVRQF